MRYLIMALVILAGCFQPVQVAANNELRKAVQSPPVAGLLSFLVGSCALLCVVLLYAGPRGGISAVHAAPWWAWVGGICGAFSVLVAIIAVRRTNVATIVAFTVAAQLTSSILIDHFGWMNTKQVPATASRIAGACLLAAGAFLVHGK